MTKVGGGLVLSPFFLLTGMDPAVVLNLTPVTDKLQLDGTLRGMHNVLVYIALMFECWEYCSSSRGLSCVLLQYSKCDELSAPLRP